MTPIHSDSAPKAIGPYSHAIQSGNFIFCSGQTPLNPDTMEIEGETIEAQTERVIMNIEIVLSSRGLSLHKIIKTNVYLSDMENFKAMNDVYDRMFKGHKPARTTIQAAGLPRNCMVEIECIAEINS